MDMNKVIHGDCLEELKKLETNSVDSIVTDPPYELGFMGKSWDSTGIANNKEMWTECLRVLKPGGHLLAFSGTRTYHRMASAIEDAGFEVRDMIEWVYGSGFPKSLNIGKMIDKIEGVEYPKNTLISDNGSMSGGNYTRNKMDVQSELAKQWEGWGTALKPAHEPICMARKPLAEKTVAENCLKWGTGGINIDESRVETQDDISGLSSKTSIWGDGESKQVKSDGNELGGRFPANLIHDNSEEVRECFPETKSGALKPYKENHQNASSYKFERNKTFEQDTNSGNASRFFKSIIYQAKASKSERNKGCEELEDKTKASTTSQNFENALTGSGNERNIYHKNNHPTVKPTALMEYLIKMVTPKGGTVLDPFAGSGTTAIACINTKRNYILIEKEKEYIDIINKRIEQCPTQ